MYPNSVAMCLWMVLGCLPWLLLRGLRQLWGAKNCTNRHN